MAGFDIDIYNRCVEVDLHCYSHRTALYAAREKIKEAYEHGFRYIRLIHGSADILQKGNGGSIKFTLRSMLKSGELEIWVEKNGSKNHKILDGSITFALRKNPKPADRKWKEMPVDEY